MKRYLSFRRSLLGLWLLFTGVTLGIHLLYGDLGESTLYALILNTLLLLIFLTVDFLRFRKAEEKRRQIAHAMDSMEMQDVSVHNPVEQEYVEMLKHASEQYCQLKQDTRSLSQERQDYYTTWVHQIKTPLAAMNMLLQEDTTEQGKNLRMQLFRTEEYVEMILQNARLEESGTDYVFASYDLDELVRKSVRKYAPVFIRQKIALRYEGKHCTVLTDEKWFCFVLEQILSNALKYTSSGSVTIAMDVPQVLTVTDTGIGIAKEDIPRVFEKGYTGYNGHADHKSTGIGLYLCKKTMDRLHHHISLTSQIGQGTTVTLDLRREDRLIE